jgi:hypothetical protein
MGYTLPLAFASSNQTFRDLFFKDIDAKPQTQTREEFYGS